jgi:hypothetical protein
MSKMLIDRAAVEQVLEALQNAGPVGVSGSRDAQLFGAMDAIRAALAQEEQTPEPDHTLIAAARAVLDRWHSPAWEWNKQGSTAELMGNLQAALLKYEVK